MSNIQVLQPGLFTTVQDLGRPGYRQAGISVTGVMDPVSAKIANWLVGNEASEAVLEITIMGPVLAFDAPQVIALTGADLAAQINGAPISPWTSYAVHAGDVLSFLGPKVGVRAYLAVSGGIQVPEVLGSRSTHVKAGFGGFEGRSLKKGDQVLVAPLRAEALKYVGNRCEVGSLKTMKPLTRLRYLPGPQAGAFDSQAIELFEAQLYAVTDLCDRMGFRLRGEALTSVEAADIISEPNQVGTIQIPGDGQPILLMQDAGTTGGYRKAGTVIGPDLHLIGQLKSGDYVGFQCVTQAEALEAYRTSEAALDQIKGTLLSYEAGPMRTFTVKVNGSVYDVQVMEVKGP